ncbi:Bacteriophage protein [Mycobacteroides abscessus subsp. abscessus]|uniref:ERF family protein n=1 Tax=Mycobacteroides abscessus TaxID=36809 RepID=UPI00092B6780|nr:ERF family protein [Mycobacteroides abscessus]SIL73716.1 Bacteriophage protein [Mycobacteroides abscessus subsp. abscessus]
MVDMAEDEVKDDPVPTVFEAWSRVMEDVRSIAKESRNAQQGFNFRGIDAVMDAVGPSLRKHGVTVIPIAIEHEAERYETAKGGKMVNRLAKMQFTVFGPRGDHFGGVTYGEAADSGDKAMTKAESVALRTFLLQALMIPTGDPDPDAESHERAPSRPAAKAAPADVARDELKELAGSKGWDLQQIADRFSKDNAGQTLKSAPADVVKAFTTALRSGLVTLDG